MIRSYIFIVYNICMAQYIFKKEDLLIRKCCNATQKLNTKYNSCVDFTEMSNNGSRGSKHLKVSDVISEDYPDFPWWMDSEIQPLFPYTLKNISSFLGGQNISKYIILGGWPPCEYSMRALLSSKSRFINLLHNGSLVYHAEHMEGQVNITFSPASYCADLAEDGLYVYHLCACLETICIRKCCQENEILSNVLTKDAHPTISVSKERIYSSGPNIYNSLTKLEVHPPYVLFVSELTRQCNGSRVSQFWIYDDGSVVVDDMGTFYTEEYCLDMAFDNDSDSIIPYVKVCTKNIHVDNEQYCPTLTAIGIIFLVLTLLVFFTVPTMGKCVRDIFACHIISQIVAYLILLLQGLDIDFSDQTCIIFLFIVQFSLIASFFWLNVMCIDISCAFSGIRPPKGNTNVQDRKKFLYYSLYAWGSPTIITIVTAVMEYVEEIPDAYLKPGMRPTCEFEEMNARVAYFYGPLGALLVVNFLLFAYTTVKIILVQRSTRVLQSRGCTHHDNNDFKKNKERLMLCGKLFCLMGLTWIVDMVWWEEGNDEYYWFVLNGIYLTRSVVIFVMFCCKRKVLRMLKQRLRLGASSPGDDRSVAMERSSWSTRTNSLRSLHNAH